MPETTPHFLTMLAEQYAACLAERVRSPPQQHMVVEIEEVETAGERAESRVHDILTLGGAAAWELILAIVKALPDDQEILEAFGAGVFEYPWCEEERVFAVRADLEERLRADPKLRTVVRSCWSGSETLGRILDRMGLHRG